ncbi:MAG: Crp/Fnr family transcriptional regulator [Candidatus Saccharimonadales bacterium]
MSNKALQNLFTTSKPTQYSAGEIIARAEDDPKAMYLIDSGFVRVYSINSRGEEYLHIVYKSGELFPLMSLTGKRQRGVFYEALDSATVYKIPIDDLLDAIKTDPEVSSDMMFQIMEQFNVYVDRVDNLEYKFGRERLVYRILFLASRFGRKNARGLTIDLPITQKVLGSSINLSRETVARELRRLEDRGLVTYEDRKILILDLDALAAELKDPINQDLWGLRKAAE